jgi:hypothetical protein
MQLSSICYVLLGNTAAAVASYCLTVRLPKEEFLGLMIKCICVTLTVKQLGINASLICVLIMPAISDPLYIL